LELWLAFVTGLTTGGLSCLAVQGGLLASSLASQVENDLAEARPKGKRGGQKARPKLALPIGLFLAAKLAAYTLLGFVLGLVGSVFQLSPAARAGLQIGIGIYMVGAALRMFNVHPIFRYFVFEPPAFLRRKLRKSAANNASLAAPLFLGAMTVLIPCGITQAMMAVALSTGSPLQGAALLFAFTLGTSPVFFTVAYFATRLGARLEKYFLRFVAVVLLVLGLVSVDTGLTLAGSPVSVTRFVNEARSGGKKAEPPGGDLTEYNLPAKEGSAPTAAEETLAPVDGLDVVTIKVENGGYFPEVVYARAEMPVRLRLVTNEVYTCAVAFVIPSLNVERLLKPSGVDWVDIPAQAKGTTIPFSCSMGMFTGKLVIE
jgi:uncharacterized protein